MKRSASRSLVSRALDVSSSASIGGCWLLPRRKWPAAQTPLPIDLNDLLHRVGCGLMLEWRGAEFLRLGRGRRPWPGRADGGGGGGTPGGGPRRWGGGVGVGGGGGGEWVAGTYIAERRSLCDGWVFMGQQSVETSDGRSGRLPDADGVWRLAIGTT